MSCIRVGEASNPGPVIGTCNPTHMLGKAQMFADLPQGLWGITETHLSCYGIQKFHQDFRFHRPKSRFLHGAPAPLLSHSPGVIGGKAVGVAMVSSFPARNLQHDWNECDFNTGRLHVGPCLINNRWVKCGTFYGFACEAKTRAVRDRSDNLLACLVERIGRQSTGPRVIMGDFNQSFMHLPCCQVLAQLGFVEIQAFAAQAWQQPIKPTSKNKQVRDFVWVSRELVPYLQQVVVDSSFFPDHAALYGVFRDWEKPLPIPMWLKPALGLWNNFHGDFGSVTSDMPSISNALEHHLDAFLRENSLPGLLQAQKGRCRTTSVKNIQSQVCPAKPGRKGAPQPNYLGDSQIHCQWLRQLRRLTSLRQVLSKEEHTVNHRLHAFELWKAILAAPGFQGGFVKFWHTRSVVLHDSPATLPIHCPDHATVACILENFEAEFRAFESSMIDARNKHAIAARRDNPHKIFQDVAKPRALPVQTLVNTKSAVISSIDASRLILTVNLSDFSTDFPLYSHLGLINVVARTHDSITLAKPTDLEEGDVVFQDFYLGSHQQVFAAFKNLWHPRWNRHLNVSADRWAAFADFVLQHVPRPESEMPLPAISVEDWLKAVRKKKPRCACGPDGLTRLDLLLMPRPLIQKLLDLSAHIEAS